MPVKPPTFRAMGYKPYSQIRRDVGELGYTKVWTKASTAFKRSHPLCLGCLAVGRTTQTAVTDHIVPPKGDQVLFWDQDNWQPGCRPHHDIVKQRLEIMFAAGKIDRTQLRFDSETAKALTLATL